MGRLTIYIYSEIRNSVNQAVNMWYGSSIASSGMAAYDCEQTVNHIIANFRL